MDIVFTVVDSIEKAPMDLLLIADPSEELVRDYLQRGSCYVARHGGRIVGVIAVAPTRPKTLEIFNIAVEEAYQNKGIAKRLIALVVEQAQKDGVHALEIGTGNPGVQQMLLYQKCGFRIVGVDPDFFRKHYPERIYVDGIECRDMVRLRMELSDLHDS